MRSTLLACLVLCGPASAAPVSRPLPVDEQCAAVRGLLVERAAAQGLAVHIVCPHARPLELPEGDTAWSLADTQTRWIAGPGRVAVLLRVDGRPVRELAVPIVLSVRSMAWIARRALDAREMVTAAVLESRAIDWPIGTEAAAAMAVAPQGRTRVALQAGDIVVGSRLAPPSERWQGDTVTLALQSGRVSLEMPAVLAADAQVGRVARVQPKGRRETLQGVLVDASTVLVER
jgi:hypothetical protein